MTYTDEMYADMAAQANETGKMLYIVNGELEINEPDYYEDKIAKIQEELFLLDQKRIRAVCEPELKDAQEGQTWLEYYNFKVFELREQLAQLQ